MYCGIKMQFLYREPTSVFAAQLILNDDDEFIIQERKLHAEKEEREHIETVCHQCGDAQKHFNHLLREAVTFHCPPLTIRGITQADQSLNTHGASAHCVLTSSAPSRSWFTKPWLCARAAGILTAGRENLRPGVRHFARGREAALLPLRPQPLNS